MEIQGKIILALPEVSGVSKSGNSWKKREYVLETHDTYPRKVFFNFFGERADQYPLNAGDEVTVSFDLESREFNGRWYTDVRAWKAEKVAGAPAGAAMPGAPFPPAPQGVNPSMPGGYPAPSQPADISAGDANDDLPF